MPTLQLVPNQRNYIRRPRPYWQGDVPNEYHDGNRWYDETYIYDNDFPIQPRPFQIEGINWLWENERGLLTDKPGLGKTLQATYAAEPPVLVVCPNYLVGQWYDWLLGKDDVSRSLHRGAAIPNAHKAADNTGDLSVVLAVGNYEDKLRALNTDHDWCVINTEALTTHEATFLSLAKRNWWNTIIFDEAHHLRSPSAKRGEVAVKVAKATPRTYLLTATPVWKEIDDLFNQFRLVRPDIFKSYSQFLNAYCVTDMTRFGVKVLGAKRDMIPELEQLLDIMRLGRSYEEAGRELPDIINKVIKVELPPRLRKLYDDTRDYWVAQIEQSITPDGSGILAFDNLPQVMQALRLQARWDGKYDAAAEVIDEVINGRSDIGKARYVHELLESRKRTRVVVFGWFHDTVESAARYFNSHVKGCKAVAISGAINKAETRRQLALDRNNNVIVATIASLGEGIDLSDAHTVIFLEEHYTAGANYQALSRVARERKIGNSNEPVIVYYIHSKDTIDESIHRVVESRSNSIREVLGIELGLGL